VHKHNQIDLPNIQSLAELPFSPAHHSWHAAHNLAFILLRSAIIRPLHQRTFPKETPLTLAPFVLSRIVKDLVRGD
jgi:hypothetical protein